MPQLVDTIEHRECMFQTDIDSEQVHSMITNINYARNGYKKYYKMHPDFIKKLESSAYIGNFPNNVKNIIWWHTGFEGSLAPSLPISNCIEVHGILKLSTNCYLGFGYYEKDESFIGVCSKSIRSILGHFPSAFHDKYIDETEYIEPKYDGPKYDGPKYDGPKYDGPNDEFEDGWDQIIDEFDEKANVEYNSFLEEDFHEEDDETSINDKNILNHRCKYRQEFIEPLPVSPISSISFISKYD